MGMHLKCRLDYEQPCKSGVVSIVQRRPCAQFWFLRLSSVHSKWPLFGQPGVWVAYPMLITQKYASEW